MKKLGLMVAASTLALSPLAFAQHDHDIGLGDIRVFNAGFTVHHLKFKVLACLKKIECEEKDLITVGEESPVLLPGTYYTYHLGDSESEKLEGAKIYLKIYNVNQKIWYAAIPLVTSYSSAEDPFYQFVCWDRRGTQPPNCSQGSEEEVGGD